MMTSDEIKPKGDVTSSSSGSRLLWMDIVRGAAILAVITFHSVTIPEKYEFEANATWRYLNETLKLFRMPILVFLSGMLLQKSLAKPSGIYFSGKIRGLLWPFLIWSTLYALVAEVDVTSLYELRKLYTGGSHLWYLVFIFVYYLAAKPLEAISPLTVAVAAFALSLASSDGAKYSERILFLMSLFFLGSFASRHTWHINRAITSRWIWLLAPIVLAFAFGTVLYDLNFGPYWVVPSLMGALFFAALAHRVETLRAVRPLIWIGQRSIIFYVSHAVFMILTIKALILAGIMNYALAAVASVLISLLGGWFLALAVDKWSSMRWLFALPSLR